MKDSCGGVVVGRRRARRYAGIAAIILVSLVAAGAAWLSVRSDFLTPPWGWISLPHGEVPVDVADDARTSAFTPIAVDILSEARRQLSAPSLSAAIAWRGEVLWAGSLGWATVEPRRPATVYTRYRLGSTSKPVTMTALARLVDAGVLDMDQPIGEITGPLPHPRWTALTLRQLASHTAGLPGYEENRDYWGVLQTLTLQRAFGSVEEALAVFDDTPLLFPPGTSFHYSSFDTTLIAAVMTRAAGRSYPELLSQLVSAPLGLPSLDVERAGAPPDDLAVFYRRDEAGRIRRWRDVDLSLKWPGGGLVARSSDVARLGAAWLDAGFIAPETRESFWTPEPLLNGSANPQFYALGWRSDRSDRLRPGEAPVRQVHHGGVSKGSMNWLVIYPELELAVAMSMNTRVENFSEFAMKETRLSRAFLDYLEATEP